LYSIGGGGSGGGGGRRRPGRSALFWPDELPLSRLLAGLAAVGSVSAAVGCVAALRARSEVGGVRVGADVVVLQVFGWMCLAGAVAASFGREIGLGDGTEGATAGHLVAGGLHICSHTLLAGSLLVADLHEKSVSEEEGRAGRTGGASSSSPSPSVGLLSRVVPRPLRRLGPAQVVTYFGYMALNSFLVVASCILYFWSEWADLHYLGAATTSVTPMRGLLSVQDRVVDWCLGCSARQASWAGLMASVFIIFGVPLTHGIGGRYAWRMFDDDLGEDFDDLASPRGGGGVQAPEQNGPGSAASSPTRSPGPRTQKQDWKFMLHEHEHKLNAGFLRFQALSWTLFSCVMCVAVLSLERLLRTGAGPARGILSIGALAGLGSEVAMLASLFLFHDDAAREDTARAEATEKEGEVVLGPLPGAEAPLPSGHRRELCRSRPGTTLPPEKYALPLVTLLYQAQQLAALSIGSLFLVLFFGPPLLARTCATFYAVYFLSYCGTPHVKGTRACDGTPHGRILPFLFPSKGQRVATSLETYLRTKCFDVCDLFGDYFSASVVRTVDFGVAQAIFGFHPHSVMPMSAVWTARTGAWRKLFPTLGPLPPVVLSASIIHMVPVMRDILQFFGGRAVGRASFEQALAEGRSVTFMPGGIAEMVRNLRAEHRVPPGSRRPVHIDCTHKGFIRLAIRNGVPVVPCYSFGENYAADSCRLLPGMQRFTRKVLGFPLPFSCHVNGSSVPRRAQVTVVVGPPLPVGPAREPTRDEVEEMAKVYYKELEELVRTWMPVYGGTADAGVVMAHH